MGRKHEPKQNRVYLRMDTELRTKGIGRLSILTWVDLNSIRTASANPWSISKTLS